MQRMLIPLLLISTYCRSLNPKVCSTSLSLARRHNIPEWEVHMSMMDCLLTSAKWVKWWYWKIFYLETLVSIVFHLWSYWVSALLLHRLSASDMQHKIKELGLLDPLLKHPQEVRCQITTIIFMQSIHLLTVHSCCPDGWLFKNPHLCQCAGQQVPSAYPVLYTIGTMHWARSNNQGLTTLLFNKLWCIWNCVIVL